MPVKKTAKKVDASPVETAPPIVAPPKKTLKRRAAKKASPAKEAPETGRAEETSEAAKPKKKSPKKSVEAEKEAEPKKKKSPKKAKGKVEPKESVEEEKEAAPKESVEEKKEAAPKKKKKKSPKKAEGKAEPKESTEEEKEAAPTKKKSPKEKKKSPQKESEEEKVEEAEKKGKVERATEEPEAEGKAAAVPKKKKTKSKARRVEEAGQPDVEEKVLDQEAARRAIEGVGGYYEATLANVKAWLSERGYPCVDPECKTVIREAYASVEKEVRERDESKPAPDEESVRRSIEQLGGLATASKASVKAWLGRNGIACIGAECDKLIEATVAKMLEEEKAVMPTVRLPIVAQPKRGRVTEKVVREAIKAAGRDAEAVERWLTRENWKCSTKHCRALIQKVVDEATEEKPKESPKPAKAPKKAKTPRKAREEGEGKKKPKKKREKKFSAPELTEEQLALAPTELVQDVGESDEDYALRQAYTKAVEEQGVEIQVAIVFGFMAMKRARFNVRYEAPAEGFLDHIDSLISG